MLGPGDLDTQLLFEFTRKCLRRPLISTDFSTRKFPHALKRATTYTLCNQHPAAGITQYARRDPEAIHD